MASVSSTRGTMLLTLVCSLVFKLSQGSVLPKAALEKCKQRSAAPPPTVQGAQGFI